MLSKALLFAACIAVVLAQNTLVRVASSSSLPLGSLAAAQAATSTQTISVVYVGQCVPVPYTYYVFHYAYSWRVSSVNATAIVSTYYDNAGCTSPMSSYTNVVEPLLSCEYISGLGYATDFVTTTPGSVTLRSPYIQVQNYSSTGCDTLALTTFHSTTANDCEYFDLSGGYGIYHSKVTSTGLQTGCSYSCYTCQNNYASGTCTSQVLSGSSKITVVGVTGGGTTTSNSGSGPSTTPTSVTSTSATTTFTSNTGSNPTTQFSGSGTGAPVGGNSNTGGSSYQADTITPQPDGTAAHPTKAKYNATGAATLSRGEGSSIIALLVAAFGIFAAVVMF